MGKFFSSKQKTEQEQKTAGTSEFDQTSRPIEDPMFGGLKEALLGFTQNRLQNPFARENLESSGIKDINNTFRTLQQSLQNRLAGQGLSGSPVAGNVMANADLARGGQIANFQTQIPGMLRQFENEDFRNALGLFGMQPMGQQTFGTGATTGQMSGTSTTTQRKSPFDIFMQLFAGGASAAGGG